MISAPAIPPFRRSFGLPVRMAAALAMLLSLQVAAAVPAAAQEGAEAGGGQEQAALGEAATEESAEGEGTGIAPGSKADDRSDLPRFVSLRASEVNLRTGPGTRYPIDWVYRRRDLPVEVIDEFDTWRRIRDPEGTTGWVHQSMLQGRRNIIVLAEGVTMRRDPQEDSRPVAKLDSGVIAELESCGGEWCVVEVQGLKGWLRRDWVWGVYPDEDVR